MYVVAYYIVFAIRNESSMVSSKLFIYFLSYPPVDDRAGPWNTAMNSAYVLHITTALLHRSCDFYCFPLFQGRPYHLAPLPSLWRHDFSPDTHSATDRRSLFRNWFVHYLMNRSFMASSASVCGLFFRTNQTFGGCWIQISYYFFQFE